MYFRVSSWASVRSKLEQISYSQSLSGYVCSFAIAPDGDYISVLRNRAQHKEIDHTFHHFEVSFLTFWASVFPDYYLLGLVKRALFRQTASDFPIP